MKALAALLHTILAHPILFELQEKLFNNYQAVGAEFAESLGGRLDLLDIGCSTGACATSIVDFGRHSYVGVDQDRNYASLAAKRLPQGRVLAMDAAALSFQAESFDRVLFVGVLHHMPDGLVRQSLAEVERVLRREGRVLIAEPVIVPEWPLSHLFLRMDRGRHIRTLRGYEALFDRFVIERHRMFQFSLHRFASYVLTKRSV